MTWNHPCEQNYKAPADSETSPTTTDGVTPADAEATPPDTIKTTESTENPEETEGTTREEEEISTAPILEESSEPIEENNPVYRV